MSNWKEVAKKHIGNADLLKALNVMKKHGINTIPFVAKFKSYKKKEDQVLIEKRTYTSTEHEKQNKTWRDLTWDMMQAIDGTSRVRPEYL